jgi:hypothetical protein
VCIARRGGRIVQDCDIYIGRECTRGGWDLPRSKWHNPFTLSSCGGSAHDAIAKFEQYLLKTPCLVNALSELRGKRLGCWCKKTPFIPCHGDVLARMADQLA